MSIDTRERQKQMTEHYARLLEQFRKRWKPAGVDAAYEEDFQQELIVLLHTAADVARQPVLDVLHNAAAMAFSSLPTAKIVESK